VSVVRLQAARRARAGAAASLSHPIFWPALVLLGVYTLSYAAFAGQLIAFPFDLDQGEGYDAWSGWLINLGQLPYTNNALFPYYSHGYPPVWSYVVSIPMAWTGPGLAPARAVSVLATLGSALLIGRAAFRQGGTAWTGALAASVFLSSPYVFHSTPLARVNALMLLLDLAALSLFAQPTWRRVAIGAVVLALAVFTKPTAIDAVVAGLLFLLLVDVRRAALATAVFGTVAGVGLVALQVASGGTYVANVVLSNSSAFDAGQLWSYAQNFGVLHAVVLLLAAANLVHAVRARRLTPWHVFAPVAALLALATIGKTGAGESYFLGTIAAVSILAALEVERLVSGGQARPGLGVALAASLLLQGLLFAHGALSDALGWLPDRGLQASSLGHAPTPADRRAADELASQVQAAPGPVLAEDASFDVVAGKELVGTSPPSLRNLWEARLWDAAPLVADLHAHRYSMVILDAELYPPPVLDAIGQSYFLERTLRVNGALYRVFLPGNA
jgi:hypothetical protein